MLANGQATVRAARQSELTEILGLLGELGRPCDGSAGPPQRRVVREILAREDVEVLVAEYDRRVVGLACLLLLPRLGHASPEARLLDLVVAGDTRAIGIGRALLAAVTRFASQGGCHVLRLECGHQRTGAQRFYRRLGFESRGEDWQLPLPTGAGRADG